MDLPLAPHIGPRFPSVFPRMNFPKLAEKRVFRKDVEGGVVFKLDVDPSEDIHVEVKDGNLVIRGQKQKSSGPQHNEVRTKNSYSYSYSSDSSAGSFYKSFSIPTVDPAHVTASIHRGVLSVFVPHENVPPQIDHNGIVRIEVEGDRERNLPPKSTL